MPIEKTRELLPTKATPPKPEDFEYPRHDYSGKRSENSLMWDELRTRGAASLDAEYECKQCGAGGSKADFIDPHEKGSLHRCRECWWESPWHAWKRADTEKSASTKVAVNWVSELDQPVFNLTPEYQVADRRFLTLRELLTMDKLASRMPLLHDAKSRSDKGDYRGKAEIIRALMVLHPEEWEIDQDDGEQHAVGITHIPTNYRYHLPRAAVTPGVKRAADEFDAQMLITDTVKIGSALAKRVQWVASRFPAEGAVTGIATEAAKIPGGGTGGLSFSRYPIWENVLTQTGTARLPEAVRGFGLGRKMYGRAIRQAFEEFRKGGPRYLMSDASGTTQEAAQNVWRALQRRGYPVQESPTWAQDLPALYSGKAKPMFGVDLSQMTDFYKKADLAERIADAESAVNTEPTEAQIESGTYAKGHVHWNGLDITIENPRGSTRRGRDNSGKSWSCKMRNSYGYIRRNYHDGERHAPKGGDGEHVDVFLAKHPDSSVVFVVDQVDPSTGAFDEHKCILGATSKTEAKETYLANYAENWKGCGDITALTLPQFKAWLKNGDLEKPLAGQKYETFLKRASTAGKPLLHYVPEDQLESVRAKGLLTQREIIEDPDILGSIAAQEGRSPEEQAARFRELIESRPHASGVSAMFAPPPDKRRLRTNHPMRERNLVPVEIDLDSLLADQPETQMHGVELTPYGEHKTIEDRHRNLSQDEVRELLAKPAKELWARYSDPEREGMYAPNVPHLIFQQPIAPKYLRIPEMAKAAAEHHHERLTCRDCGSVQTCRCSAPKVTREIGADECWNCKRKAEKNASHAVDLDELLALL